MASESQCQSSGAISMSAFQLVTATRYRSVEHEARQCHTDTSKKADSDSSDAKSYRPISNLSVLSKSLERLVSQQLVAYLRENDLLPDRQSAYRAHHSTETAVIRVMSDILLALDSGNIAVLTLLDLSAAFDSVDHSTLLQPLQTSYGLGGPVLA